jgi:hypothetical protein
MIRISPKHGCIGFEAESLFYCLSAPLDEDRSIATHRPTHHAKLQRGLFIYEESSDFLGTIHFWIAQIDNEFVSQCCSPGCLVLTSTAAKECGEGSGEKPTKKPFINPAIQKLWFILLYFSRSSFAV